MDGFIQSEFLVSAKFDRSEYLKDITEPVREIMEPLSIQGAKIGENVGKITGFIVGAEIGGAAGMIICAAGGGIVGSHLGKICGVVIGAVIGTVRGFRDTQIRDYWVP